MTYSMGGEKRKCFVRCRGDVYPDTQSDGSTAGHINNQNKCTPIHSVHIYIHACQQTHSSPHKTWGTDKQKEIYKHRQSDMKTDYRQTHSMTCKPKTRTHTDRNIHSTTDRHTQAILLYSPASPFPYSISIRFYPAFTLPLNHFLFTSLSLGILVWSCLNTGS